MSTMIFVNLPVADLAKSQEFYRSLGYTINEEFSDDKGSGVVISDTIWVMLLTREFAAEFTTKPIADATQATEVINALSAESRAAVDELADKALAAGGTEIVPPSDQGFMYSRSFADLDGHHWEVVYMAQEEG